MPIVLVFGSPVYFSDVTGMMRCFCGNGCIFPNFVYDKDYSSLAPQNPHRLYLHDEYSGTANGQNGLSATDLPKWKSLPASFSATSLLCNMSAIPISLTIIQNARWKFFGGRKAKVRETPFPLDCRKAEENRRKTASGVVA